MQCEETTGYKVHIILEKYNNKQHLQVTTRCRHRDGCRIDSKPQNKMAHLLQLFLKRSLDLPITNK